MSKRPNILWLIADDAGWNDLGCYGNSTIRTPHIDRLAAQGVCFDRAFVTSPQCSPSRASLWTGEYAHSVDAADLHDPLPADVPILPEWLGTGGYHCGVVGKLHLGAAAARKFDYRSAHTTRWSRFLDERPPDKPFFLCVGYYEPHRPYTLKFTRASYPAKDVIVPPYLPDLPRVRRDLSRYYTAITRMDRKIGALLSALRERGLDRDTLIVFVSDNGLPFPRAKGFLHDPGIRVPLIISWPDILQPGRREGLVSLLDLAPTTLDLVGLGPPAGIRGRSFSAQVLGRELSGREKIFAERNWHDADDHARAVRTQRYKYIRNFYFNEGAALPSDIHASPSFRAMRRALVLGLLNEEQKAILDHARASEELYDLQTDPDEFNNLAGNPAHGDVLQELRHTVEQWSESTADVSPEQRRPTRRLYRWL